MDPDNGENNVHTSENEVEQPVPAMPEKSSDAELQLPEDTTSSGSYVWKHFTKDPDYKNNQKASCNYCNKTYICSHSTTSGMSRHLQKYHNTKLSHKKAQRSVIDMLNESKVNIFIVLFILKNFHFINNKYVFIVSGPMMKRKWKRTL